MSATPTKTPRGKGRDWIPVRTTLLGDTDLILAGQDARLVYTLLLLHSGDQGLNGGVPSARAVQLFAHLDGGVPAAQAALDALVEYGKLEWRDDALRIRTWERYQNADFGGSATRAESNRTAAFIRAHKDGKHTDRIVEGCSACAAAIPAPAGCDSADAVDVTGVRALWQAKCDQVLAENDDVVDSAYLELVNTARGAAEKFGHIAGVTENVLLNDLVSHAALNQWKGRDEDLTEGTLAVLHGWRATYGTQKVLSAVVKAHKADSPYPYAGAILKAGAPA